VQVSHHLFSTFRDRATIQSCFKKKKLNCLILSYPTRAKYASKYSAIYQDMGYDVIQLASMSSESIRTAGGGYRERVKTALNLAEDLLKNGREKKVIFHIFSNGGLKHYLEFINLVEGDQNYFHWKDRVKAVVLDSAPVKFSPQSAAEALTSHLSGLTKFWQYSFIYFSTSFIPIYTRIFGIDRHKNFRIDLLQRPGTWCVNNVTYLYLYSVTDRVSDYQFIEAYMQQQSKNGAKVMHDRFESSAHVAHLVKYRERYQNAIKGLLTQTNLFKV